MVFVRIIILWFFCYLISFMFVWLDSSTFFGFGPQTRSDRKLMIYSCIGATALIIIAIWLTDGDILKPSRV